MLLVGSIIAHCRGEDRVKERAHPRVVQGIQHPGWDPGMQSWVCLVG